MDHDTATAVAKAVAECNEGWQRKIKAMIEDGALRRWCVEQAVQVVAQTGGNLIASEIHKFITEPLTKEQEDFR